jgi:hypothetical protein
MCVFTQGRCLCFCAGPPIQCPFFQRCCKFLDAKLLPRVLFDFRPPSARCCCRECFRPATDAQVFARGDPCRRYIVPVGYGHGVGYFIHRYWFSCVQDLSLWQTSPPCHPGVRKLGCPLMQLALRRPRRFRPFMWGTTAQRLDSWHAHSCHSGMCNG